MPESYTGMTGYALRISESMNERLTEKVFSMPGSTASSVVQMYLLKYVKDNSVNKKMVKRYHDAQKKTVLRSIWLTEKSLGQIRAIAKANGISTSEAIRKVIMKGLEDDG